MANANKDTIQDNIKRAHQLMLDNVAKMTPVSGAINNKDDAGEREIIKRWANLAELEADIIHANDNR